MKVELLQQALQAQIMEANNALETALSVKPRPNDRVSSYMKGTDAKLLQQANKSTIADKTLAYTSRHRGQWFVPEYDFQRIKIAQDQDSMIAQATMKKLDKFIVAGWEFTGKNRRSLEYIKKRIGEISAATNKPWNILLIQTAQELFTLQNALWVKKRNRNASSGKRRRVAGRRNVLDPVAGYFIADFETLEFKTKPNGDLIKVRQVTPEGETVDWSPDDVIHFYHYRRPGYSVGTPALNSGLDDIMLLRRIEENVEELIETNLFPVYHYQVGTDESPERWIPDREMTETEVVKRMIEYQPASGFYVTDHRHKISALGSESKALRIDFYLSYFMKRAIMSVGMTPVDLGIEGEANRSTASTMSKAVGITIQAMQAVMKNFIDFYVIGELLLEGGFNPFDSNDKVEIQFGIIDREEQIAHENNMLQKFTNKAITQTELRKGLGLNPLEPDDQEDMYYRLYEEPLALLKIIEPGPVATETLSKLETSNLEKADINRGRKEAARQIKTQGALPKSMAQTGAKGNGSSIGSQRLVASKNRPSNQTGTRLAPKLTRDYLLELNGKTFTLDVSNEITDDELEKWKEQVHNRFQIVDTDKVSIETFIDSQLHKLNKLHQGDN